MNNKLYRLVEPILITFFYFILMFIMLVPQSMAKGVLPSYPINNDRIVQMIVLIWIVYYFGSAVQKRKRIRPIIWWVVIYCVIAVMITYLRHGDYGYAWLMYCRVFFICTHLEYIITRKRYKLLEALTNALNILVLLNYFSVIRGVDQLFTHIYGNTYLLGFDNGNIIVIMPTIALNYLVSSIKGNGKISVRVLYAWIISIMSVIAIDSSTSTVGLATFGLLILLSRIDVLKLINKKVLIAGVVILFITINILRMQNIFSGLITGVLGKDITFTGRVALWDVALTRIRGNMLLGYGIDPEYQRSIFYGVSSAHNEILDVLYQRGLVGLISFAGIYGCYLRSRPPEESSGQEVHVRNILDYLIGSFLLMMLFESYNSYITFGLIICLPVIYVCIDEANEWKGIMHHRRIKIRSRK